jgi:hypothetical protein
MIFRMFSLVTTLPVMPQNNTVTPTGVAPSTSETPSNVAGLVVPYALARQRYLVASVPLARPKGLDPQFFSRNDYY